MFMKGKERETNWRKYIERERERVRGYGKSVRNMSKIVKKFIRRKAKKSIITKNY